MRRIVEWGLLAAVLLMAVALAVGAYLLATHSWDRVVDYRTPYADLDLPTANAPTDAAGTSTGLATTTVLVIVDGLGDEASRAMEGLNRLRDYGSDYTLIAPQPSLSFPNWTTILSGAPPYVSGVPTNWWEGRVPVETLVDTAVRANASLVVVGPEEFEELYGADRSTAEYLKSFETTAYASTQLVEEAVRLIKEVQPRLAIVHLPDVDNAGHRSGAASQDYTDTVAKVDADLRRLIEGLQGDGVAFVVTADHGHIDAGGHGGWESAVVAVPGVFIGSGISMGDGNARQEDVAPTVAVLAGIPVPRFSKGDVIATALAISETSPAIRSAWRQRATFAQEYVKLVLSPTGEGVSTAWGEEVHGADVSEAMDTADAVRLAYDRGQRLWIGLAGLGAAVLVLIAVAVASWRALLTACAGALAYYVVYNGFFFLVHGYRWSLSAFNEETQVESFFNGRMLEAALAGLLAVVVAALVYPLMREHPKPPSAEFLPRWLLLGPVTVLVIMATLGAQVAWFVWAWGIDPVWRLPDLMWAFKYDLDLIQVTALGAAAVLGPLVAFMVGKYHPRVRRFRT